MYLRIVVFRVPLPDTSIYEVSKSVAQLCSDSGPTDLSYLAIKVAVKCERARLRVENHPRRCYTRRRSSNGLDRFLSGSKRQHHDRYVEEARPNIARLWYLRSMLPSQNVPMCRVGGGNNRSRRMVGLTVKQLSRERFTRAKTDAARRLPRLTRFLGRERKQAA